MSDQSNLPAPAGTTTVFGEGNDKAAPLVIYILFLLGLTNGLTAIIGLVMAYMFRERSGDLTRSHYLFQVRTCWMGLAIFGIALVVFVVGIPLTLIGIGILMMWAAGSAMGLIGVWFAVRCVMGLYYLMQDQPYPRPDSWLI